MTPEISHALPPFNKRGQRLGAKGIATRDTIMDATLHLLNELPLWQINPSDIAAASDIRQSNFYTYFDNVEEVVLAIALRVEESAPDHRETAPSRLDGAEGLAWVRSIVVASIAEWQTYGPVLRIVEMLADNDVPEFREARRRRLNQLHDILALQIRRAQSSGDLSPRMQVDLTVYSVLSLIRVTAEHYGLTLNFPMTHDDIVATAAHTAHLLLTGKRTDETNQAALPDSRKTAGRATL